jgi:hypothetical protein
MDYYVNIYYNVADIIGDSMDDSSMGGDSMVDDNMDAHDDIVLTFHYLQFHHFSFVDARMAYDDNIDYNVADSIGDSMVDNMGGDSMVYNMGAHNDIVLTFHYLQFHHFSFVDARMVYDDNFDYTVVDSMADSMVGNNFDRIADRMADSMADNNFDCMADNDDIVLTFHYLQFHHFSFVDARMEYYGNIDYNVVDSMDDSMAGNNFDCMADSMADSMAGNNFDCMDDNMGAHDDIVLAFHYLEFHHFSFVDIRMAYDDDTSLDCNVAS